MDLDWIAASEEFLPINMKDGITTNHKPDFFIAYRHHSM